MTGMLNRILPLLILPLLLASCPVVMRDCIWGGSAQAWLDANQNGTLDPGESPLEGALFHVDDIRNGYRGVARRAVSDAEGKAQLSVWLPGCPDVDFVVSSEAPGGYRRTSPAEIHAGSAQPTAAFLFGYAYLPGVTPTPRPVPAILDCRPFSIPYAEPSPVALSPGGFAWIASQSHTRRIIALKPQAPRVMEYERDRDPIGHDRVTDIAVGPDGSVWYSTLSGVTQFHHETNNWTTHIKDNGMASGVAYRIAPLPGRDVVVQTKAGIELLDRSTIRWRLLIEDAMLKPHGPTGFLLREEDVLFAGNDRVYRFWRDETADEFKWEVFWDRIQDPAIPADSFTSVALERDGTMWVAGQSATVRQVLAVRDPADGKWTEFTYSSTGGAIGSATIRDIAFASDGSVWLNEGVGLVRGDSRNGIRAETAWINYAPSRMGLNSSPSDPLFLDRLKAGPDGSLWFWTSYTWYRCEDTGG